MAAAAAGAKVLQQVLASAGQDRGELLVALDSLGVQNDTDLLLRTDTPGGLEDLQDQLALCVEEVPESLIADLRKLAQRHRLTAGAFTDSSQDGQSPILFTAPHSIYLQRKGHAHHVPEWHTSDLANKFAQSVKGAYLTWTAQEEKRNKELFDIAGEPDTSNKDPNFTNRAELGDSPWTREIHNIRKRFGQRPCLHVDLHGCRNPQPNRGSHVVVGLRAMELAGREDVQALREELHAVLNMVLKGFHVCVQPQRLLTGAWDVEDGHCTLTQQSLSADGGSWTHAVQLEMCATLRKALSKSSALHQLLAQGLLVAWVLACRHEQGGGWAAVRSQCMDLLNDWTRRCSHFFNGQDLMSITKPKRQRRELRHKESKVKGSDDSEDEPERLSANSEPPGFLCAGPTQEMVDRCLARGDAVWSHVWEAMRDVAVARPLVVGVRVAPRKAVDKGNGRMEEEAQLLQEVASRRAQGDQSAALVALSALGELQLDTRQPAKAMKTALEAAEFASALQDHERQAEAIRLQVGAQIQSEGPLAGLRLVREASSPSSAIHDSQAARPALLLAEADCVATQGLQKAARRLATEALQASRALGSLRARALCATALATACLSMGDVAAAVRVLEDTLEACRGAQGELGKQRAGLLRALAGAQTRLGKGREAQETAEEAIEYCQRIGDGRGEVSGLQTLAGAYLEVEAHREALDTAKQAGKLAARLCDEGQRAACLHLAASVHMSRGEVQDALEVGNEMLTLARPLEDVELMSNAMELVLSIYAQAGAGSKALLKANAQLRLAKSSNNPRLLAAALQWMASAQQLAGQPEEALKSAKQARAKLEEAADKRREALACHTVAGYLADMQQLPEALQVCQEAITLQRDMGDQLAVAQTLQFMVDLCWQRGADVQAEAAAWEQHKALREAGYKDEEASCLLRLADLTWKSKGGEAALKHAKAARCLYQELGEKESEAKALLSVAHLYMEDQRLKTALKVAREAQELCRSSGIRRGEADALLVEARVHLSECEKAAEVGSSVARKPGTADAKEACLAASKQFESLDDSEGLAASLQLLSHCHWVAGNGQDALKTAREAIELHDVLCSAQGMAAAELSEARAHVLLGDGHAAVSAASQAAARLAKLGEEAAACREEAEQLLAMLGAGC